MKKYIFIVIISMIMFSLRPVFAMDEENNNESSKISGLQTTLRELPPYDWNTYFCMPVTPRWERGNQVLHNKSTNKYYKSDPAAMKFVDTYLRGTTPLVSDADVLKYGVEAAGHTTGFFLEMGVGMGRTINFIAALSPTKIIYGFDSFEGLPEDWDKGDKTIQQGTFACKDLHFLPPFLSNVKVYKGLFADTLIHFSEQILKENQIAFLHIDCDSYTPTKDVFTALAKNITPGTVIVFDELYNYPNYTQHEWKALQEFLEETGYDIDFLAFNINHEQVAVKIKNKDFL